MTPKQLLAIVAKYYGLKSIKQLGGSERLSSWRYQVHEETRQIACLVLQRHCESEPEDLQVALKKLGLDWRCGHISMCADKARRKLTEGDFCFRLAFTNVEQMILEDLKPTAYITNKGKLK